MLLLSGSNPRRKTSKTRNSALSAEECDLKHTFRELLQLLENTYFLLECVGGGC
jgi:hypothetical protein